MPHNLALAASGGIIAWLSTNVTHNKLNFMRNTSFRQVRMNRCASFNQCIGRCFCGQRITFNMRINLSPYIWAHNPRGGCTWSRVPWRDSAHASMRRDVMGFPLREHSGGTPGGVSSSVHSHVGSKNVNGQCWLGNNGSGLRVMRRWRHDMSHTTFFSPTTHVNTSQQCLQASNECLQSKSRTDSIVCDQVNGNKNNFSLSITDQTLRPAIKDQSNQVLATQASSSQYCNAKSIAERLCLLLQQQGNGR